MILQNLTQHEKAHLCKLFAELRVLSLPKRSPGAFNIFLKEQLEKQKLLRQFKSSYVTENDALKEWSKMTVDEQAVYEGKADLQFRAYQTEYEEASKRSEAIREQIDEIQNRANFASIVKKKVSPYRVFKKEIAAQIKSEFPNMRSQERQMIVKERWRYLSEAEKVLFVVKARIEEEKQHYYAIKDFYDERIQYSQMLVKEPQLLSEIKKAQNLASSSFTQSSDSQAL